MVLPDGFVSTLLANFRFGILAILIGHLGGPISKVEGFEQSVVNQFSRKYSQNQLRLEEIDQELEKLPVPYGGEPTGSGGFLSQLKWDSNDEVVITFNWDQEHRIDAIALFPLRLFMDGVYGENLYWANQIAIETDIGGQLKTVAQLDSTQLSLHQSLPDFLSFEPVETDNLVIRCSSLQKYQNKKWFAAGFAEIFIFAGYKNVAPFAKITTNGSREGSIVLSSKFINDGHTPLGLANGVERKTSIFYRKSSDDVVSEDNLLVITLSYLEPVDIDTVRIDPATHLYYGRGFPTRFVIELLDQNGKVVARNNQYRSYPLRNPALNSYFAYFSETKASTLRLKIFEVKDGTRPSPHMDISEISPLFRGQPLKSAEKLISRLGENITEFTYGDSTSIGPDDKYPLFAVNDGYSGNRRILSQRKWAESLHLRQQLMEEKIQLQKSQKTILNHYRRGIQFGGVGLIVMIGSVAAFTVRRNQIKARKHILQTRAQIASDLHDDVGSNLSTIILQAEMLQALGDPKVDQGRLEKILRLARESVLGLHEVLQATAPEIGHPKTMVAHLKELTELMLGHTYYEIDIDPKINDAFSPTLSRGRFTLFYKEAIHNAKKHAQCSRVDISLKREANSLVLSIADDGIGISEESLAKARTLRTLKNRAEWLDGQLEVLSAPGQGTQLILKWPQT